MLSVVIVTKNEARNIEDCLKSAAWADEVIVLDSGSSDDTVKLAVAAGARVIETDWPGYGPQQNRGIDAASYEWVYSLDADERITPQLAAEIRHAIEGNAFNVFDVPRSSLFVNRFMRHSGWWPDRTRRLFRKGRARFTEHKIHANLATQDPVGHLKEAMTHYSFFDYHSVVEKMNRYSSGSAEDLNAAGKRGSLAAAIGHGLWTFIRTYFIKAGFLDGQPGLILAIANAEGTYYKYLKLWELQNRQASGQ
ncbi:MAG: glycosyltransferase family 2 protein [Methylobacter sp.]|nr:glycosyltransferase family 2 protein [Methylobacter sp.]MDP2428363.1 glycosyltransferase family 2 protein [Methylobacter sp.]MDP3053206.1 glycosyltransferase family 2 protein [Methylobacter sp.]MDP3361148.1 glycosyltransferase family 2 protein [Methylobacter sp.]MDZ4218827.1 glycosyltransferase family 2 protein [Methylobacter sp.]